MELREFNDDGIKAFRAYLSRLRTAPATAPPKALLEDEGMTRAAPRRIEVEAREFANRADAAAYHSELLGGLSFGYTRWSAGLWSWLSLLHFDQVCPETDGIRKPRADHFYIFEPDGSRTFYLHLLFIGWWIRRLAPEHNRLFLQRPLHQMDRVTTDVMTRLYIARIPCMFELLDRLYWDEENNKPRHGISGTTRGGNRGDLRNRLPLRIRQLEKTYDLHSLTADQLLEILGPEFDFGR